MRLYLVQHGEAVPENEDPERPLTVRGREDIHRLGGYLAAAGVHVNRIVHSGKLRASDSAAMLREAVGREADVEVMKGMLPKDSPVFLAEAAATWKGDTLVVGHEPFMNRLVSRLVLGAEQPSLVEFNPGTLVCLRRRPATGAFFIAGVLPPDWLRR
jgi:phosphohistidine phosphatase